MRSALFRFFARAVVDRGEDVAGRGDVGVFQNVARHFGEQQGIFDEAGSAIVDGIFTFAFAFGGSDGSGVGSCSLF